MIIGFPSPMQQFEVCKHVPKHEQINYSHFVGRHIEMLAPIDLKPNDHVWIDTRNGKVEIVERGGVTIWRAGWLN